MGLKQRSILTIAKIMSNIENTIQVCYKKRVAVRNIVIRGEYQGIVDEARGKCSIYMSLGKRRFCLKLPGQIIACSSFIHNDGAHHKYSNVQFSTRSIESNREYIC